MGLSASLQLRVLTGQEQLLPRFFLVHMGLKNPSVRAMHAGRRGRVVALR